MLEIQSVNVVVLLNPKQIASSTNWSASLNAFVACYLELFYEKEIILELRQSTEVCQNA